MFNPVAEGEIKREQPRAPGFGRWLSKWLVWLYRLHLGRLLGRQFILITQPVCRSEMLWQTGVTVSHYDRHSRTVRVIASQNADWYRNLRSSPAVEITMGREHYRAEPHFLEPIESAALLRWSRRHHPIAMRIRSWLFGWPWNPSAAEMHDLAYSLGGVTFRPVSSDGDAN